MHTQLYNVLPAGAITQSQSQLKTQTTHVSDTSLAYSNYYTNDSLLQQSHHHHQQQQHRHHHHSQYQQHLPQNTTIQRCLDSTLSRHTTNASSIEGYRLLNESRNVTDSSNPFSTNTPYSSTSSTLMANTRLAYNNRGDLNSAMSYLSSQTNNSNNMIDNFMPSNSYHHHSFTRLPQTHTCKESITANQLKLLYPQRYISSPPINDELTEDTVNITGCDVNLSNVWRQPMNSLQQSSNILPTIQQA
ncbi:unnamed protein product [Heterobilharzia americana]|nr:unnamed protein product [Heterobilharzia americana]